MKEENTKKCSFEPFDTYKGKTLFFTLGIQPSYFRPLLARCKKCKTNHVFSYKEACERDQEPAIDTNYVGVLTHPDSGGFPAYNE